MFLKNQDIQDLVTAQPEIGRAIIRLYDLYKNNDSNLVIVCKSCHNKIHNNEINIDGYVQTSEGKQLQFNYVTK